LVFAEKEETSQRTKVLRKYSSDTKFGAKNIFERHKEKESVVNVSDISLADILTGFKQGCRMAYF
jgi:hypothetical protein